MATSVWCSSVETQSIGSAKVQQEDSVSALLVSEVSSLRSSVHVHSETGTLYFSLLVTFAGSNQEPLDVEEPTSSTYLTALIRGIKRLLSLQGGFRLGIKKYFMMEVVRP